MIENEEMIIMGRKWEVPVKSNNVLMGNKYKTKVLLSDQLGG